MTGRKGQWIPFQFILKIVGQPDFLAPRMKLTRLGAAKRSVCFLASAGIQDSKQLKIHFIETQKASLKYLINVKVISLCIR